MNKFLALITSLMLIGGGCTSTGNDPGIDGCHKIEISDIVTGYQLQTWEAFAQLTKSNEGNVVYSPLSLQQVLAMILAGSAEGTYSQISQLLRLSGIDKECIGMTNYELIDELTKEGQLSSISTAYYDERFTFDQNYATFLDTYFDITPQQERFADPSTVDVANTWASDATEGRIDQLLDEVESNEVLLLLHVLHLKADWKRAFMMEAPDYKPSLAPMVSTL